MQIIPAIDLRNGKCVRLRQGDYAQETIFGDFPADMALHWQSLGARRLHLVDLDGAKAGQPVNVAAVREIVRSVGIPCQLGGGIREEAAIRLLLDEIGVERLIVGTQALKHKAWFEQMAQRFPGRLILGIDARGGFVATEGWLDISRTSVFDLARQYVNLPLAALIYTNIANDGMMQGIDAATLADLCALADLGLPVIASGGVTTCRDVAALREVHGRHPQLQGAIVGRALYEGTLSLADALAAANGVCIDES